MSKIRVRLFVHDSGSIRPYEDLSEEEREALAARCGLRIGETLNDYFSRNAAEYNAVKYFHLTDGGGAYGHS